MQPRWEEQLIPDPVWNADSFASQYHNAGSGIRNNEKNQRSAASLYIAPGFAHYKSQAACNELI